jgi:hypothetical protein
MANESMLLGVDVDRDGPNNGETRALFVALLLALAF